MEIELSISVNKSQIEFEYFIQKDNCFEKFTMKTVIRDKAQCTQSYNIVIIIIIIIIVIIIIIIIIIILCIEFVDPLTIEPIVASRRIPLDKGNGEVCPIGVGEVIRRIIGKYVTRVAKQDVINASGTMQVCAGQKSGGEAAIHAMRNIFEADETDAALLVDASNAFNSLNRAAALNNIRVLCPLIATYVTNTYRVPARLFVVGGSELKSAEGTTQGALSI